jgi:quercetin dioxygenase-like cupin family protein
MQRLLLTVACAAALCATAWISSAQQPTTFTGAVTRLDDSKVGKARIRFEPRARTYWHIHSGGQVLLAEEGHGRAQAKDGPIQELVPAKPVFAAGGVAHWHGAAPDEAYTQVSLQLGDIKWLGPVSDEEYDGRKR